MRAHNFICPIEGCPSHDANPKPRYFIDSLRGLKRHMTHTHGGWTPDQISGAIGETRQEAPGQAQAVLEGADGEPLIPPSPDAPEHERQPRERATSTDKRAKQAQVRMSTALQGFREQLAQAVPDLYLNLFQSKMGIGGSLPEKMKKSLSELWGAYLDLLGFDIQATPLNFRISGKLWIFAFPVLMIPVTFFSMTGRTKIEPPEESEETQAAPASEVAENKEPPVQ